MAFPTDWSYRKSITLSRASGAVTNYQMKLKVGESAGATGEDVDCGGLCKTDFSDLRFANSAGVLLNYWIESVSGATPNQLATIWIKFDSIGTGATTFYMYYGNPIATAVSNGTNTFLLFDDFSTDTTAKYTSYGSSTWNINTTNKYLRVTQGVGCYINTANFTDFELMCDIRGATAGGDTYSKFVEWRTATTARSGYYLQWDCAGQGTSYLLRKYNASTLASNATIPTADTWHTCHVKALGTAQSVQLGAYTLLSAADATFGSAGKIGFTGDFFGIDYLYIRNLRVKPLIVSEPDWGSWGAIETVSDGTTGNSYFFVMLLAGGGK